MAAVAGLSFGGSVAGFALGAGAYGKAFVTAAGLAVGWEFGLVLSCSLSATCLEVHDLGIEKSEWAKAEVDEIQVERFDPAMGQPTVQH